MSTLLLWVPLPPPFAGPEVASQALIDASRGLLRNARIENATVRRSNLRKGRLDIEGVVAFARAYRRFLRGIAGSDAVYLIVAANTVGCLRDALLIATARGLRKQVIVHLRGGRYREHYATASYVMRFVLRHSWGSARRAIVQTPRLRDQLAEAAPHVEVVVVPNGLPEAQFPPKRSYVTAAPRILFVGHLMYSKGFHELMLAFRQLRKEHPEAILSCAGELPRPERSFAEFLPPPHRDIYMRQRHVLCDEIRRFVAAGESEGVHYAGVVSGDTKRQLFESADIFVLPSYTEGFSLAVLEAMFHGLPVIASAVGGIPDIVQNGTNGLVIRPGDIDGLTDALRKLVREPVLREVMGRENARIARENYDLANVARAFADALDLKDAH